MARLTAAFLLFSLAVLPCASAGTKPKAQRIVFKFDTKTREAYFFVPEQQGNLPVLLLLHGSGRDGRVMIDEWKDLAAREGIVLAAPNALHDMEWNSKWDSPEFLHAVVDQARALHPIDDSRIYLFGHSAGAQYALVLALVDSNFYAAAAIHAGTLPASMNPSLTLPRRHMPIAIWAGDLDFYFPADEVRETKRLLDAHGFNVQLFVLAQHDHNYYAVSSTVNPRAWQFLSPFRSRSAEAP
jgi:poly(3-hydroxybutyrate) depolymerase